MRQRSGAANSPTARAALAIRRRGNEENLGIPYRTTGAGAGQERSASNPSTGSSRQGASDPTASGRSWSRLDSASPGCTAAPCRLRRTSLSLEPLLDIGALEQRTPVGCGRPRPRSNRADRIEAEPAGRVVAMGSPTPDALAPKQFERQARRAPQRPLGEPRSVWQASGMAEESGQRHGYRINTPNNSAHEQSVEKHRQKRQPALETLSAIRCSEAGDKRIGSSSAKAPRRWLGNSFNPLARNMAQRSTYGHAL